MSVYKAVNRVFLMFKGMLQLHVLPLSKHLLFLSIIFELIAQNKNSFSDWNICANVPAPDVFCVQNWKK